MTTYSQSSVHVCDEATCHTSSADVHDERWDDEPGDYRAQAQQSQAASMSQAQVIATYGRGYAAIDEAEKEASNAY